MQGGLVKIPGERALHKAYDSLLHKKPAPSYHHLALYSQWARFDPRLAEIWVRYVSREWVHLNPLELRLHLFKQPWPSCAGVLLLFVKNYLEAEKHLDPTIHLLEHWSYLVAGGALKGCDEQFFVGLRQVAGKSMFDDARYSLSEYRKWGYFSRENLTHGKSAGSLSVTTRQEMLRELLEKHVRIRTATYWEAIGRCVSKRQAERDLEKSLLLRIRGQTSARYFVRR